MADAIWFGAFKILGQFFTPPFLKQLVVNLVDPQLFEDGTIETIYDPVMGTNSNIKINWEFIITSGIGGIEVEPGTSSY